MIAYVGQSRGAPTIARLERNGLGECTQPREMPPRRTPWFLDNGAFHAWRAGVPWDARMFGRALRAAARIRVGPDFIVIPDIVAGGLESFFHSMGWARRCARVAPSYLAVQDGMDENHLDRARGMVALAGVFVGGSLGWKLSEGGRWVRLAHDRGMRCHVGRVGVAGRVSWARRIGADSIDSCVPLWSRENMARFLCALQQEPLPFTKEKL